MIDRDQGYCRSKATRQYAWAIPTEEALAVLTKLSPLVEACPWARIAARNYSDTVRARVRRMRRSDVDLVTGRRSAPRATQTSSQWTRSRMARRRRCCIEPGFLTFRSRTGQRGSALTAAPRSVRSSCAGRAKNLATMCSAPTVETRLCGSANTPEAARGRCATATKRRSFPCTRTNGSLSSACLCRTGRAFTIRWWCTSASARSKHG